MLLQTWEVPRKCSLGSMATHLDIPNQCKTYPALHSQFITSSLTLLVKVPLLALQEAVTSARNGYVWLPQGTVPWLCFYLSLLCQVSCPARVIFSAVQSPGPMNSQRQHPHKGGRKHQLCFVWLQVPATFTAITALPIPKVVAPDCSSKGTKLESSSPCCLCSLPYDLVTTAGCFPHHPLQWWSRALSSKFMWVRPRTFQVSVMRLKIVWNSPFTT